MMKSSPFQSIRFKLSIAMVILTLAILIIAVSGKILTDEMKSGVNTFGQNYLPAISSILNADRDLYQAREAELEYLLGNTSDKILNDFNENAQQALDRMNKYKALMSEYPDIIRKLDAFDTRFSDWKAKADRVLALIKTGNTDQARALSDGEAQTAFKKLRNLYNLAGEELDAQSIRERDRLEQQISTVSFGLGVFIFIVLIIAGALTYLTPKLLVTNIRRLTTSIQEISEGDGDLTLRINSDRKDELGELADTFDTFVSNLETLISDIRHQAESMNSSSAQLEQSADSSMKIVNEQSQEVEMIATAVEEFSTAIRDVAENAQRTASETAKTVDISHRGRDIINDSVIKFQSLTRSVTNSEEVIGNLAKESENIASVLDVIRGIADQTNLLALNAAIEAARAGDHGRGFAVVSDEVRSLASKTQASTEEIQAMIEKLQTGVNQAVSSIREGSEQVNSSVELVESTQDLLSEIETSATQVNDMAIQIASATEEQSLVTDEINRNLAHLSDQNQVSNELTQNTQTISTSFKKVASDLYGKMKRFKVGH
ncbi:methyl-accepting chemotaxis protein [Amphritea atlantica]|uniref:Methyl-accepting chemotaxis protein n=1 Tax=Amphritea atlantica TaxID=355243 RepID=A0A1H9FFQ1_9GAMM|nr:methyl-accepting chemotaxis protein [Amphritea atlantica]SEQ36148.1 methyl-accepting chemotaxis protein [Amphritea atlantica]